MVALLRSATGFELVCLHTTDQCQVCSPRRIRTTVDLHGATRVAQNTGDPHERNGVYACGARVADRRLLTRLEAQGVADKADPATLSNLVLLGT